MVMEKSGRPINNAIPPCKAIIAGNQILLVFNGQIRKGYPNSISKTDHPIPFVISGHEASQS